MPPKKKTTKASAATPARASPLTVPATITTHRGKEIETTAALARPRRAVAPTLTAAVATSVKTKKSATKTAITPAPKGTTAPAASKKRGPPTQIHEDEAEQPPKKRGRSPKKIAVVTMSSARKPGRATKVRAAKLDPEEAPAASDTPARRKRNSGPKGGQTTKIATADDAAADQLEDELVATADGADSGKQYWLMKAEQVDREETLKSGRVFNTKFTIDDLKERRTEPWDGVRNMVARNNMRAMSQGDLAFFYASQAKGKLQPGITGIMEVVKEAEPDQSVFDEDHYGFVEPAKRAKENQWSLVHVAYRKKLSKPVSLKELQKFGKTEGGVLSNMQVLKQSRLSVTKVTEKEWNFIVDSLIDGYEEDPEQLLAITTTEAPTASARQASRAPSRAASRQLSLAPPVLQTTETPATTDNLPVDSAFPTSDAASIMGASRAGSRKPTSRAGSRAPSVKPTSRGGSLAPGARGRSRTPKPAATDDVVNEQPEQLNSILEED